MNTLWCKDNFPVVSVSPQPPTTDFMTVNEKFVFSRALGRLSTTFPQERPANDAAHTFLVTPECFFIVELYKVIKSFADALKFQLF